MTWYDGSPMYEHTDEEWKDEDTIRNIFSDERIKTCEEYFDDYDFETFEDSIQLLVVKRLLPLDTTDTIN